VGALVRLGEGKGPRACRPRTYRYTPTKDPRARSVLSPVAPKPETFCGRLGELSSWTAAYLVEHGSRNTVREHRFYYGTSTRISTTWRRVERTGSSISSIRPGDSNSPKSCSCRRLLGPPAARTASFWQLQVLRTRRSSFDDRCCCDPNDATAALRCRGFKRLAQAQPDDNDEGSFCLRRRRHCGWRTSASADAFFGDRGGSQAAGWEREVSRYSGRGGPLGDCYRRYAYDDTGQLHRNDEMRNAYPAQTAAYS
jgi:hypothetical protein